MVQASGTIGVRRARGDAMPSGPQGSQQRAAEFEVRLRTQVLRPHLRGFHHSREVLGVAVVHGGSPSWDQVEPL
jgi:hypothetical protein